MDNKTRKIYDKALDFYEKGEINRALDLCEIALAEDLRQSEILNFKGLMLYQRGMLKEAVTVWKLNLDINKDAMAKSYIKDSERDEERMKLYKEAEKLLKKSDVNSALKLFLECAKSDFNCIKVNTGIAWCYQKKGDYYRAKGYIDKALKVDKNAVTANEINSGITQTWGDNQDADEFYGIVVNSVVAPQFYSMPEFVDVNKTYQGKDNGIVKNGVIGYFRGMEVMLDDLATKDNNEYVTWIIKKGALGVKRNPVNGEAERNAEYKRDEYFADQFFATVVKDGSKLLALRNTVA